ncbi:bolA-like protein isoform 2-T2 [Cochliomyia hominivorax]
MINITRLLIKNPLKQTLIKFSTMAENRGPVAEAITVAITKNLQPVHLEVINESYMHNVPKGAETHFKVLIVSDKFEDLPLIKNKHQFLL